ncbi:xanthine dehydrogenase family protein molybdopterin-binding subunit [Nonomuraea lactucae]|uniref:xanthine dehydrogenase family protein molybdopterin-binding subunit n=1 Tax=Nonomuraea lactucae TaxID=2249762 RepID=UPI000DE2FA64|nr:xanthine dehydrogenase family protein molybdopterin-binding subunit [Nonomuraea lactucae]
MTSTNQAVTRLDGPDKVTGRARYAVEYGANDVAYAWPVQATCARGRLDRAETDAALAVPGVLDVLTHENVLRLHADGEISPAHMGALPDLLLLQSKDLVFRGQLVAAVIAETPEAAREGAAAVVVVTEAEHARLELTVGDDEAIVPDITNDLSPGHVARGDADRDFADAPVRLDTTYSTAANFAMPMEPHAAMATWDGDRLTVHASDQGPPWTAMTLAGLLGLPPSNVEVVAEYVGGGFGSKAAPRPPIMLAVLAARLVGRPVKVALNRQQSTSLTTYRGPSRQRIRIGAGTDGRISSVIHETTGQTSRLTTYADQTVSATRLMYRAEHCRTTTNVLPLDVPTPAWVRAPGEAPGMFALESAMDELAVQLGMDPIELRVLNEPETDPESGLPFTSRNLVSCLRIGAERFGWSDRRPEPGATSDGRWRLGMGVAAATYPHYLFPSTATARVDSAHRYTVRIGAADIGTGARTALHQIAADALKVPMSDVRIELGRASHGSAPFAGGSMGTASWGAAIESACRELRRRISAGGGIPDEGLEAGAETLEVMTPSNFSRHAYGAHFAAVRVDRDTGEVQVDRMLGVFATGRIINPLTAKSQAVGAMIMGMGMALMEAAEPDTRFGGFVTQDLAGYHVPAHADVRDIDAMFLTEEDPNLGPIAGRGVGEIGIVGTAAAITNAIHNATGIRIKDLPVRAENLLLRVAVKAGER